MTYEEDVKNAVGSLEYWYQQEYPRATDFYVKTPKAYPTPQECVENYYKVAGIKPEPILCRKLMEEEYLEWLYEVKKGTSGGLYSGEAELKELADLVFVIYGYALSRGWDLNEAFSRVYHNNLKRMVWDDGEIHRDDNGKILKSPTAPKCDLSDLV